MQWIILIGNKSFTLQTISSLNHEGCTSKSFIDNDNFHVTYGDQYISYFLDDIISDYDETELEKIPHLNPNFIVMRYSSNAKKIVNDILCNSELPKDLYVDDDHGVIVPIEQYIKYIQ